MTSKVGPKGQVVIPKAIRDELGIRPGDHLGIHLEGGQIVVRREEDERVRRLAAVRRLRGASAGTPGGGTKALEESRGRDRVRENRPAGWDH